MVEVKAVATERIVQAGRRGKYKYSFLKEEHNLPQKVFSRWRIKDSEKKVHGEYQNYVDYIRSPEWKEKRKKFLKYFNSRCFFCGCTKEIQIHHRDYKTLGNETIKDVIALCRECHFAHHDKLPFLRITRQNRRLPKYKNAN